jgi:hypothetical protein
LEDVSSIKTIQQPITARSEKIARMLTSKRAWDAGEGSALAEKRKKDKDRMLIGIIPGRGAESCPAGTVA